MMTPHDEKTIRWIGFAASIPGGGHIRHGVPCQDASAVMTSPRPAAIVCDGRGSASLSHYGAQGAVDAFRFQLSVLEPFLVNILDKEEEKTDQWIKFCRIMYRTLMQVKYDLAEKHNTDEKEFDCKSHLSLPGKSTLAVFRWGMAPSSYGKMEFAEPSSLRKKANSLIRLISCDLAVRKK